MIDTACRLKDTAPATANSVAGIGVPNWQAAMAATFRVMRLFYRPDARRLWAARAGSRKARRSLPRYANPFVAAHPIGVGKAVRQTTERKASIMNASLGAPAPLLFAPSPDQSAVRHLRILIHSVKPLPDGSLAMDIICGDIGCRMHVPNAPCRPDFAPGQCYLLEYPKGQKLLAGQFTAIYPADQNPQPERKTAMTAMIALNNSHPVTMSSLEMVEYINSTRKEDEPELRHRDFLAKVPKVLGQGVCEKFRTPYKHPQNGQTYYIYRFPKREACLMAMSYSYELQARVYDKMTALEQQVQQQPAIPQTLPDALRLAADLAEQKARAEEALALAAPKAAALDRIAAIPEGSLCITDAAKALGKAPKAMFKWLQERQWIYRRPGGSHWIAYQHRLQTGVLDHKITTITKNDGSEKIIEQVLVTAKGMARLSELMGAMA